MQITSKKATLWNEGDQETAFETPVLMKNEGMSQVIRYREKSSDCSQG